MKTIEEFIQTINRCSSSDELAVLGNGEFPLPITAAAFDGQNADQIRENIRKCVIEHADSFDVPAAYDPDTKRFFGDREIKSAYWRAIAKSIRTSYLTDPALLARCDRVKTEDEIMGTSEAARVMGSKTSAKKAAAVRENGKKGGRPRKNL